MGGELAVRSVPDRTTIATDVLSERGPEAATLMASGARRRGFPASELSRVKARMARDLAIQKSTPQAAAQEKFAEMIYGDHPYGRLFPTEAMLGGYTLDQVRTFHRPHFARGRSRLYVAGVFDRAPRWNAAIRDAFGTWGPARRRRAAAPRAAQARVRRAGPSRRAAVHDHARPARAGSLAEGLDRAAGDRLAPRRLVRLAHHVEHP